MKKCAVISQFIIWMTTFFLSEAQTIIKPEQLYNLNEDNAVDKIILSESRNLDSAIYTTKIWLSDEVANQFDPVFGVIINKNYVLQLAEKDKIKDIRNLFRLIISHEKMHALQFARLQSVGKNFDMLSTEDRQLLECQADMCAGFLYLLPNVEQYTRVLSTSLLYMFRNNTNDERINKLPLPVFNNDDSIMIMAAVQHNQEGINLFFTVGENEGVWGIHPNSVHRKEAFQLGVNAFNIMAMSRPLPREIADKIKPAEWEFLKSRYDLVRMMLAILPSDYNQFNSFFESWSYRTAFKVIHYNYKACSNLIFKITRNKWDTNIANPFLYFEMDVINNNPDSILVDISVPVKLVSRRYPADPLKSTIGTCWYKLFPMAPGATLHVKDSVMWPPGNDSVMPRVFYPGEEGSMYAVQPIRPKTVSYYLPPVGQPIPNPGLGPIVKDEKLIKIIPSITRSFYKGPTDDFKDGAGIYWLDELEVKYNCYRGNHHFLLNIPLDTKESPFLSTIAGTAATLSEAKQIYAYFKSALLELDNDYSVAEHTSSAGSLPYAEIMNPDKQTVFALSIDRVVYGYEISLEIEKL